MTSRINLEKPSNTPAPGAYKPEQCKLDHPPAYTFGVRPNIDHIDNIPG